MQASCLMRDFWRMWMREYLPDVQTRRNCIHDKSPSRAGGVMMVSYEHAHMARWPCFLEWMIASSDGVVWKYNFRTATSMPRPDVFYVILSEIEDGMNGATISESRRQNTVNTENGERGWFALIWAHIFTYCAVCRTLNITNLTETKGRSTSTRMAQTMNQCNFSENTCARVLCWCVSSTTVETQKEPVNQIPIAIHYNTDHAFFPSLACHSEV